MVREEPSKRQRRVGESVREELARMLLRDASDSKLAWTTITAVEMSPDLKLARVFFVTGGESSPEGTRRRLDRAAPFLQREVGHRLRLKHTPKLVFFYDDSLDRGARIDELVAETRGEGDDDGPEERRLDRAIDKAKRILISAHANPDGDAIGSILAMAAMLRLGGKDPVVYCPEGVPGTLRFLPGADRVSTALPEGARFDLTLLLDTADEKLFPDGFPGPESRGTLAVIDHHAVHGEIGDVVVRRRASAVGEILFLLARELAWPVDRDVAQCLYVSIVADTGSFRYSSTTATTHRVVADLIEAGADPWSAAVALYESFPISRQRLLALVAGTLWVSEDGRYADLHSTPEMLSRCEATRADLDGMINLGRQVVGVQISSMFRVEPTGEIKVSFRSKGRLDVAVLAARFGGGGHRNAAGCTLEGRSLEEAKALIRSAAAETFEGGSPGPPGAGR